MTELWRERWPNSRPIAHELKTSEHNRWVRFHSLPDSKRYADTEAEYQEILHRHATVLRELNGLGGYLTTNVRDLLVVTCSWSDSDASGLPDPLVNSVSPGAWSWLSIPPDEDDETWTHLFVEQIDAHDPRLDALLRLVADDEISGVIISDPQLTWLYHPYDGGADVIAANTRDRDDLRERHASWLSQDRSGL